MVEIIPKPTQKLPAWQNILFYLSIVVLLAVVLTFFILNRSFKRTEVSLKNLEETLSREKTPAEVNLEKETIVWQKKIKDFSQILEQHLYPSKAFDFLGEISHPKAWFKQFNLDLKESKIVVSGETESFTTLGQQLLILEGKPLIKNFTLSSLSIGKKGKVDFTLNISLDAQAFKK